MYAEEQEMPQLFQHILLDDWHNEVISNAWKRYAVIKLPKKGNLFECSNWRGITLLSMTSKFFCSIILQRITTVVDKLLRQEQAGFRMGISCIDHIFVLRQILEQPHECSSSLYVVFVYYEVFDNLHRPLLWKILQRNGIPQKLVNINHTLYKSFECRVVHNHQVAEPFRVDIGVNQGCILSPVVFSKAVDWFMRTVTQRTF